MYLTALPFKMKGQNQNRGWLLVLLLLTTGSSIAENFDLSHQERNICTFPKLTVPFEIGPFECHGSHDSTEEQLGNCGMGSIDSKETKDSVCLARGADCFVGWTEEDEYLYYQFASGYTGLVDVTVRVASLHAQTFRLKLDLNDGDIFEQSFHTPGKGWDDFEDVVWKNIDLTGGGGDFNFLTIFFAKHMNFCSISIKPSGDDNAVGGCTNRSLKVPFDAGPFDCKDAVDFSEEPFGNCGNDSFDAKRTGDSVCLARGAECFVGWTEEDEYLMYQFASDFTGLVDITVRVASLEKRTFRLYLDLNYGDVFDEYLETPGKGWEEFEDVVWKDVDLSDGGGNLNFLAINFANDMNFCSISIKPSESGEMGGGCTDPSLKVPFDAGPFDCKDAYDSTEEHIGSCGNEYFDAKETSDSVCLARGAECFVGWTDDDEYLYYQFASDHTGLVDITVRVASLRPRKFGLYLDLNDGDIFEESFETPGKGWDEFEDVVWKGVDLSDGRGDRNFLTINFSKDMNFCSISIKPSESGEIGGCTSPSLKVPFDAGAFDCKDAYDSTEEHIGNCGNAYFDAKETSDSVCLARGAECFVGWTDDDEYLYYQFASDHTGLVDITVRVASLRARKFSLYLDLNDGDVFEESFETPGKGWDEFEDVVWKGVDLSDGGGDRNFLTINLAKDMNFCSLSITPVVEY